MLDVLGDDEIAHRLDPSCVQETVEGPDKFLVLVDGHGFPFACVASSLFGSPTATPSMEIQPERGRGR